LHLHVQWIEDWCVTVNKDKSSTALFTLSPKKQASPIKIDTHTLKEEDQATYLCVTFDKRLTWKPHTLSTEGKARKKLAIMRKHGELMSRYSRQCTRDQ